MPIARQGVARDIDVLRLHDAGFQYWKIGQLLGVTLDRAAQIGRRGRRFRRRIAQADSYSETSGLEDVYYETEAMYGVEVTAEGSSPITLSPE